MTVAVKQHADRAAVEGQVRAPFADGIFQKLLEEETGIGDLLRLPLFLVA